MAKRASYRQCHLRKELGAGTSEQVSYIPEPYCVVGRVLKLRRGAGEWDDGWVVTSVGERRSAARVETGAREHLKARAATDI